VRGRGALTRNQMGIPDCVNHCKKNNPVMAGGSGPGTFQMTSITASFAQIANFAKNVELSL
jgi:hypothetical protein